MEKIIVVLLFISLTMCRFNSEDLSGNNSPQLDPIHLVKPDLSRGLPVMEAFSNRASSTAFNDKKLSEQDLSDLLFAANGINRKVISKRTAPSAQNAQDIDIYVFIEEGVYFYDAQNHLLNPVVSGDHRGLIPGIETAPEILNAPAILVLVSELSRKDVHILLSSEMSENELKLCFHNYVTSSC